MEPGAFEWKQLAQRTDEKENSLSRICGKLLRNEEQDVCREKGRDFKEDTEA